MSIDHQSTGFISSQQTEYSEHQQRAISLGKALVQELELDPGVDTLSRWIAHYITEQIAVAERATGEEKAEAEKRCFDSIMQLWQHRYALPNGRSPFKEFTSIFETFQRLNPENQEPFYIRWEYQQYKTDDENPSDLEDAKLWLKMALSIDKAARVIIEASLQQAALRAAKSDIQVWLQRTPDPSQDFDVQIITGLIGEPDLDEKMDDRSFKNNSQESNDSFPDGLSKKAIKERIEYLETFLEFAMVWRDALQEDLVEST